MQFSSLFAWLHNSGGRHIENLERLLLACTGQENVQPHRLSGTKAVLGCVEEGGWAQLLASARRPQSRLAASSASSLRSPRISVTWPARACPLNRSTSQVRPLLSAST